jgi:hypothetical protein
VGEIWDLDSSRSVDIGDCVRGLQLQEQLQDGARCTEQTGGRVESPRHEYDVRAESAGAAEALALALNFDAEMSQEEKRSSQLAAGA